MAPRPGTHVLDVDRLAAMATATEASTPGLLSTLGAQLDAVVAAHRVVPFHLDATLGQLAELGHVRALGAVHHECPCRTTGSP